MEFLKTLFGKKKQSMSERLSQQALAHHTKKTEKGIPYEMMTDAQKRVADLAIEKAKIACKSAFEELDGPYILENKGENEDLGGEFLAEKQAQFGIDPTDPSYEFWIIEFHHHFYGFRGYGDSKGNFFLYRI